ncbi:microtubule-associated protein futsch-like isoform X2 [Euwallacea similis]|uniref:microtubule-associated protein futsch-like isoform X2 n=1 Tax=Euwallacea similis TaxID=1736056 RepID=UPI00344BFE4C
MDLWKTDLDSGDSASVLASLNEFVESPTHLDYSEDESSDNPTTDQIQPFKIGLIPKNSELAKKRLQAYCAKRCESFKAVRNENDKINSIKRNDKPKKMPSSATYPNESAKAVIRNIELLKRAGYGFAPQGPSPALPAGIIIPEDSAILANDSTSSLLKSVSEHGNMFKRREIKCRNIRKNDSTHRRSVSPRSSTKYRSEERESTRNGGSSKKEKEYPKNWTEYKEMGLNFQKDQALKRLHRKSRERRFEFKKYFNFEAPPPPIESYKIESQTGEFSWVPFSYLRCTATEPSIMYSTNQRQGSKGFLTREQVFNLIPRERRFIIEKLSKCSKRQPEEKSASFGKWYPKSWKKSETSEATLLENSVGLSFLQSYSDEEPEIVPEELEVKEKHNDNLIDDFDFQLIREDEKSLLEDGIISEELTPTGTPKVADIDKDDLSSVRNDKKSEWEEQHEEVTEVVKGNVDIDVNTEEYKLVKEKLKFLEASIEGSESHREEGFEVSGAESVKDRKSKKKHKKNREKNSLKVKPYNRKSSKKAKKQDKSNGDDSLESDDESDKKKKKKRKKRKHSKLKISKEKRKKLKKRKGQDTDSEQIFDLVEIRHSMKRTRKDQLFSKKKKERTISGDSQVKNSDRKSIDTEDNTQENYEDDIKFFADRLDAEKKLKGKSKNKNIKAIIMLDDLTLDKDNVESIEQSDSAKKNRDKIEDVKVDLLKLNEAFLKEQSGEADMRVFDHAKSPLKLKEEIKTEILSPKSDIFRSPLEGRYEELLVLEDNPAPLNTKGSESSNKNLDYLDMWEEISPKRKQQKSETSQSSLKQNLGRETTPELIPLSQIKQEKDVEISSWESDEDIGNTDSSLDIQLPSTTEPSIPIEVKVEKDILSIEELHKLTAASIVEGKNRLKKDRAPVRPQNCLEKVSINVDPEFFDIEVDVTPTPNKGKRWDVAEFPKIKLEKLNEVIDLESNNSGNALENQYEEFIKSVEIRSPCKPIEIDSSSDCSLMFVDEFKAEKSIMSKILKGSPVPSSVDIPTIQIPLPPIKTSDPPIKPVPSPSPKIEAVLDLNQPMINLSLSANVTQNITLSLATSMPSISAPTTSTKNVSKPSVEISNDTTVSMNNIPLPMSHSSSVDVTKDFKLSSEPLINISPTAGLFRTVDVWASEETVRPTFTSLTLPSKKVLDSRVRLDDSDAEDEAVVEETRRRKLEDLKKEIKVDEMSVKPVGLKNKELSKSSSLVKGSGNHREPSPKRRKKEASPHSSETSRKRSPRRRGLSPRRRSPMRRSPFKRRKSPGRRSLSPRKRRHSPSPRRRLSSPPRNRHTSPRRRRSISPKGKRLKEQQKGRKSPTLRRSSPLKLSVADSTISDDQLPQMNFFKANVIEQEVGEGLPSPRRIPLDVRIREELEMTHSDSTKEFDTNIPLEYDYGQQYSTIQSQISVPREFKMGAPQSTYRQVGNMLQIVPTDDLAGIPMPVPGASISMPYEIQQLPVQPPHLMDMRPKILQVGNMLQIVPTDIVPPELSQTLPQSITEIKTEKTDPEFLESPLTSPEKASAEYAMLQKIAERRAEREMRRLEREIRREAKEKRRKEKEKIRQAKMKAKTESMIKRALELEEDEEDDSVEFNVLGEQPVQWPPLSLVVAHKEAGKGILVNRQDRDLEEIVEKRPKYVQFADGIRPGEGTSPSAGEDLTSPPPPQRKLPKEKRFTKVLLGNKSKKKKMKKKVKVKVIKRLSSPMDDSDSEDNLPPPSPPPGSPPPHVFPPRIKIAPVNNVPAGYLASIIHSAQQQQQQQAPAQYQSNLHRAPVGIMMASPALSQGHLQTMHHHLQSPLGTPGLPPMTVPPPSPHQVQHSTGSVPSHQSHHVQSPLAAAGLPPNLSLPPPSPHTSGHLHSHPPHIQSPHGGVIMPPNLSVAPHHPASHSVGHLRHY